MAKQYTSNLMMVRPANFQFNAETATSNSFQHTIENLSKQELQHKVLEEFDEYVQKLTLHKINVLEIQDTSEPIKPDAIFPNNWISMQEDGTIFLYPMCNENRRLEVRSDIVEKIKQDFEVVVVNDLRNHLEENKFLEGTGSIIFDHIYKIAYACISPRTDENLFLAYCNSIAYKPIYFHSTNQENKAIYHTNVMLTIGDTFAIICLESIIDEAERKLVKDSLTNTNHEIIEITFEQMNAFAGNMLQVINEDNKTYLVMSETAFDSLRYEQIQQIEAHTSILSVSIPTIETIGGGSARCMLAEIFLKKR